MLADSVEAASRTLDKPTLGRIEDLVTKIIDTQLADGQLDQCDLTQRDLRGIQDARSRACCPGCCTAASSYPDALKPDVLKDGHSKKAGESQGRTICRRCLPP